MDKRLTEWLEARGFGRYAGRLDREDISFDVLLQLTEADLRDLDLPLGPRRALTRAIAQEVARRHAPHTTSRRVEPERRQVTILFCDIVGSTQLSLKLDPEEMREILGAWQRHVCYAIERFDGHVSRFLGDGVLALFGWPQAYEDQAERALNAALAMNAALAADEHRISMRIGVATGLVVIGELGSDPESIVGETPNLAQRLQACARPGGIVVDQSTRALVGEAFVFDKMHPVALKGFPEAVAVWSLVGERAVQSRFESSHPGRLTPFIGRVRDVERLSAAWRRASAEVGEVVLVAGEPGIGKSRLIQHFCRLLAREPHVRLRFQCSPLQINSPLHPVVQRVKWDAGFTHVDDDAARFAKLEATIRRSSDDLDADLPIFALLVSVQVLEPYQSVAQSPSELRGRFIEVIVRQLLNLSRQRPLLVILEDAHWMDPTTDALLAELASRIGPHPILLVITYRSGQRSGALESFRGREIVLERLSRSESDAIVGAVGGDALPSRVKAEIYERSDGVPLYVEELAKSVLESDTVGHVPQSIQSSLAARLDRLGEAKEVAQLAAAIGRSFSYPFLAAVCRLQPAVLDRALARMVESGLLIARDMPEGKIYRFHHALIQDVAYETLLRSRRRQYHDQIAEVLLGPFSQQVADEPELLARHLSLADRPADAVEYWLAGGQKAARRAAHAEAVAILERGLHDLEKLPHSGTRNEREFDLRIALGASLLTLEGWSAPRVTANYERARELSGSTGDLRKLFVVLRGQANVHFLNGEIGKAQELVKQFTELAEQSGDSDLLLDSYRSSGMCALFSGQFEDALALLSKANAIYDRELHHRLAFVYGTDPGVVGLSNAGWALWFSGDPEAARSSCAAAVELARSVDHPFSIAYAHALSASLFQFCRMPDEAWRHARAAVAVGEEHDHPYWIGWGTIILGWCVAKRGRLDDGLKTIRSGVATYRETGARQIEPYATTLLAEVQADAGDPGAAVGTLDTIVAAGEPEVSFYLAETWRLRGECARAAGLDSWDSALKRSLQVAREQRARILEIRATLSILAAGAEPPDDLNERLAALSAGTGSAEPDIAAASSVLAASR